MESSYLSLGEAHRRITDFLNRFSDDVSSSIYALFSLSLQTHLFSLHYSMPSSRSRYDRSEQYCTIGRDDRNKVCWLEYNNKKKQEDSAKKLSVELSKNAQFRAIRPNPSIISFVEDNLLGPRRDIQLKRAGYNIERCWLIPHESIWSPCWKRIQIHWSFIFDLPALQNLFQANSSLV